MIVITTKTYNCNNAFTYNKCINNTIVHLKLLIFFAETVPVPGIGQLT